MYSELFCFTVNPLLSSPEGLFISNTFEGGRGEGGLILEWGIKDHQLLLQDCVDFVEFVTVLLLLILSQLGVSTVATCFCFQF